MPSSTRRRVDVFASRELRRKAVVAENATTAADGKTYKVAYLNLDAMLLGRVPAFEMCIVRLSIDETT